MTFPNYTMFGGRHADTAAVRNILAFDGVMAPHTGEPFSEALLLGLGGGLSAGYFAFQYGDVSTLYIGTRGLWYKWDGSFIERIVQRVGGTIRFKTASAPKPAAAALEQAMAAGRPLCVWTDLGGLPQSGYAGFQYSPQVVVACGYDADADEYTVDDTAQRPWHMSAPLMSEARGLIKSLKYRSALIESPARSNDLAPGIMAGIEDCIADLNNPRMKNFGLTAIEKWADLVANTKDPKGWPRAFASGPNLFRALMLTWRWIGGERIGGGFRGMYGEFLNEAAAITGRSALVECAAAYTRLGEMWVELAEVAFPKRVKAFKETRDLTVKRRKLIDTKGEKALEEIRGITAELMQRMMCATGEFPMTPGESSDLLHAMEERLRALHAAEVDAMRQLSEAVR